MTPRVRTIQAVRSEPSSLDEFGQAVLKGLSAPRKRLPCQYFYDAAGSELFEEITRLEEYYPTRAEHGWAQRARCRARRIRLRVEPQDRAGAGSARGPARLRADRCLGLGALGRLDPTGVTLPRS